MNQCQKDTEMNINISNVLFKYNFINTLTVEWG